jgi:hypothetical protein
MKKKIKSGQNRLKKRVRQLADKPESKWVYEKKKQIS